MLFERRDGLRLSVVVNHKVRRVEIPRRLSLFIRDEHLDEFQRDGDLVLESGRRMGFLRVGPGTPRDERINDKERRDNEISGESGPKRDLPRRSFYSVQILLVPVRVQ